MWSLADRAQRKELDAVCQETKRNWSRDSQICHHPHQSKRLLRSYRPTLDVLRLPASAAAHLGTYDMNATADPQIFVVSWTSQQPCWPQENDYNRQRIINMYILSDCWQYSISPQRVGNASVVHTTPTHSQPVTPLITEEALANLNSYRWGWGINVPLTLNNIPIHLLND